MALLNLFAGKEWRHRCREWTCGHSRDRECERNGESGINMYTLSGVRWIAAEKLLCSTGSPVWCSMMTWRDAMEGGEEG